MTLYIYLVDIILLNKVIFINATFRRCNNILLESPGILTSWFNNYLVINIPSISLNSTPEYTPGRVASSGMCLTADPGVVSSIPARPFIFVGIDHEMISTAILLPSAVSRRVVVSYKRKHVHEVLVNCLVKIAQEKKWLGKLTVSP